jgi:hypothetical protein
MPIIIRQISGRRLNPVGKNDLLRGKKQGIEPFGGRVVTPLHQ